MNTTATPDAPATTTGLTWAPALSVGDARMDETHEEFVTVLNQLLGTPQAEQLPLYLLAQRMQKRDE